MIKVVIDTNALVSAVIKEQGAEADYLITGNARHFPTEWKGTQVVNARNLIAVLQARPQL